MTLHLRHKQNIIGIGGGVDEGTSVTTTFENENENDEEKACLITATKDTPSSLPSSLNPKELKRNFSSATVENGMYMAIFFFGMIFLEIGNEAVTKKFHDLEALAAALTLFQFGTCFAFPLILSKGKAIETFPRTFKELFPYVGLSILVFGATALATQSLRYVSYPTKIVFKSAKLIPTMIVSTILQTGSKYRPLDYLAAALLCAGAAGYSHGTEGTEGGNNSTIGIFILIISIICDALVPNIQKRIMCPVKNTKGHPTSKGTPSSDSDSKGLSAAALMVNTNAVGFSVLLLVMTVSGMLTETIKAAIERPELLLYLCGVGMCLACAVLAYTRLIRSSGPVVAVATATLRKVVTVLLSYIIFPKPLLPIHIFSSVLVFGGIFISSFCRRR